MSYIELDFMFYQYLTLHVCFVTRASLGENLPLPNQNIFLRQKCLKPSLTICMRIQLENFSNHGGRIMFVTLLTVKINFGKCEICGRQTFWRRQVMQSALPAWSTKCLTRSPQASLWCFNNSIRPEHTHTLVRAHIIWIRAYVFFGATTDTKTYFSYRCKHTRIYTISA